MALEVSDGRSRRQNRPEPSGATVAFAPVVAYHLAPSAVPGGFLGVDVFFVLSGFLITSLLPDKARGDRSVDLGRFYVRRPSGATG